jgi:hypothetical protein
MTFGPDISDVEQGIREPGQVGAWRSGIIIADRHPVGAVVEAKESMETVTAAVGTI